VSSKSSEDAAVVAAVLDGERQRFRELVQRYERRVFALVRRMIGARSDVEDLTQQAFIEAYRALPRYDAKRSFSTWLMRIAVNNCKDYLKSHKRRETGLHVEVSADAAWASGHLPAPDLTVERRRELQRVAAALETLDDKYRVPVLLKDVQGLSYDEMQQIIDLPLTTLKIRVVRGRAQLLAALDAGEKEGGDGRA
jgi:RNA polymerase sigma-70 factor (ECF subfamily)